MCSRAGETLSQASIRIYDDRAASYEASWHPDYSSRFVPLVPLRPGDAVLSLCCGTGLDAFLAAAAVGPTGRVVGVDVSPRMLAVARAKPQPATSARVELLQRDVTALGDAVPEGAFDAIVCSNAFVLLGDPAAVVRHWRRYLKAGGVLAVDITHENNMPAGLAMERVAARLGREYVSDRAWITGKESFQRVLEAEGFTVERVEELEKVPGERTTYYRADEPDKQYDYIANLPWSAPVMADEEFKAKGRSVFAEEWAKRAVDGKVEVKETLYVYIARKTEKS